MLMTYYNICDTKARVGGLDELLEYLETDRNLTFTKEESDDIISVEVEVFDEDTCTDFVGCWEFDKNGKFLE